jgi:2-C-methyl-D-erythritol 4-phosphate cytidylyltransferase
VAKFAVIMPAAGQSSRFNDRNYKKPYAPLADRAVWLHTADRFLNRDDVAQVIIVISPEDRPMFEMKFGANIAILGIDVVDGGQERADSVRAGLERVRSEIDYIAVHDAVRPCLTAAWIDEVFAAAKKSGAAILAQPITATLKRSTDGKTIKETVDRTGLWEAQTPQVFRREILERAYAQGANAKATDEASLVEQLGVPVTLVAGSPLNLKITTRDDLRLAEQVLKALPKPKLGGMNHPFADGDLWR